MSGCEDSIDLTPGIVWDEAQLAFLRDVLGRTYRAEQALVRVRKLIDWLDAEALDHRRQAEAQRHNRMERISHVTHLVAGAYQEDAAMRLRAATDTPAVDATHRTGRQGR